jgi:hypothetical protein
MTAKEHLAQMHKSMAEHHKELAECCGAMSKCAEGVMAKHFGAMAKIHADASDSHAGFAAAMEKAIQSDLQKLQPDAISSVARSEAPTGAFRAVPRDGAPAINKSEIDPQFRHLLSDMQER